MEVNNQTNLKLKAHLYKTLHKTEILTGDIAVLLLSSLLKNLTNLKISF